jgi:hypothetical protein
MKQIKKFCLKKKEMRNQGTKFLRKISHHLLSLLCNDCSSAVAFVLNMMLRRKINNEGHKKEAKKTKQNDQWKEKN